MTFWRRGVINQVIFIMIMADFLMISATGFVSPIMAVFISGQVAGGSLAAVGFATTVFWVVKSAAQVPVSLAADAGKGEVDDFVFMIIGSALSTLVQLGYFFFATQLWHVYVLQAIDGAANAMMVPTFLAIFTRHIDKHRENTEWAYYSNAVGLGFAIAAALGGVLAEQFGFRIVFLLDAIALAAGTVVMLGVRKHLDDGRLLPVDEHVAARERTLLQ